MPTGIYQRTDRHRQINLRNLEKSWKKERTAAQLNTSRNNFSGISNEIRVKNLEKAYIATSKDPNIVVRRGRAISKAKAGVSVPHKGNVFADTIVRHHIDGNRSNNHWTNIQIITHSWHMRVHRLREYYQRIYFPYITSA